MVTPALGKLLVLQDRDQRRLALETQLQTVPREIAAVNQRIAAEQASIETARGELRELEVKKKTFETEIGGSEEQLARYKNQQMQVRKNDEYQALGHEIENTQARISTLEEEELKVMFAIDEAKRRFLAAEKELKENIASHEARIRALREREINLQSELDSAQEAVAAARGAIDESNLRLYDRLAVKPGLPAVVPIRDGKCGGCHLRPSSNVTSEVRKHDKLITCDQCTRIIYWEG